MRLLLALLFAVPAFSASYTCVGTSADPTAINGLLAAGGSVVITGPTCAIGTTTLLANVNGTSFQASGSVTLSYTGTARQLSIGGNSVTVNGFTFNGGGILTSQSSTSTPQTGVTITNNVFQNITMPNANAQGIGSSGYWSHFTIDSNTFHTISSVAQGSVTASTNVENGVGGLACTFGPNLCFGIAIENVNGADNTVVTNNTFDFTLGDSIHMTWNWLISSGTTYHVADSVSISNNSFVHVHRIPIETGGGGACIGSCNFGNYTLQTNRKYAGNFARNFLAPYQETFAWSIPDGSPNPTVINNSAVMDAAGTSGYCFEAAYNGVNVFQGNTCAANTGATWNTYIMSGTSTGTLTYQNNILVGALQAGGNYFGQEGSCSGCFVNQYNVATASASCVAAGNCANSSLATGSGTITPSGTTATLSAFATDQIAVKNVQFTLDAALITTQEVQDQNTNFTTDQKWLYSHAFTGLSAGAHTVQAIATDVSGATSTTTQSFTIAGAGVNPTNVQAQYLSHSSMAIVFGATGVATNLRIRYGTSSCSAGTGGTLQVGLVSSSDIHTTGNSMNLAGLAPAIAYFICVELSNDSGATYSTGNEITVTTLALPTVHPAKPIAPMVFDTSYPNTSAFVDYPILSDCSNFGSQYVLAVDDSLVHGARLLIPAGTVCTGGPYAFEHMPPDVFTFMPTAVNTSNGQINIPSHGLSEGDLIQFSLSNRTASTYPASTSCPNVSAPGVNGGIQTAQRYKAHVIDSSHFQATCLDGSTIMQFTTQGSTPGGFYMTPWRSVNGMWQPRTFPIIIRSAVPDAQLPPPGVTITPAWASKMAIFQDPVVNIASCGSPSPASSDFIVFGDTDDNFQLPIGNLRFGPGIEITTDDAAEAHTSSDPDCWGRIIFSYTWNRQIIFDRIWFHGQPTPNRMSSAFYFDGSNMAQVNSYWDNLTYYHSTSTNVAIAQTAAQLFTVQAGSSNPGTGPIQLASIVTGTVGGSGTGEILLGFDLLAGKAFKAWLPAAVTLSCAGVACPAGSGGTTTNGSCNVSDGWPKDSYGNPTVAIVACLNVLNGSILSVIQGNPFFSAHNNEGCSFMLAGIGPGPYFLEGNYYEGAGLILHFDASGQFSPRGDYTLNRNYMYSPLRFMWGNASNGNLLSDGLAYFVRQFLEWKGGNRQKIKGNVLNTTWRENITTSMFIVQTPREGGFVSDVEEVSNTFMHGPGVTANPYAICTNNSVPCAPPSARFWYHNNLSWDINGWRYSAYNPGGNSGPGQGWLLGSAGESTEDVVWDHNTYAGVQTGALPGWLDWDEYAAEGFTFNKNVYALSGIPTQRPYGTFSSNAAVQPSCAGLAPDKDFLDCAMRSGVGNTSYSFGGNVILGGYTDASATPSGQISSGTINTLYGSLTSTNSVVAGANVPATIASIKWYQPDITASNTNFTLRYDSGFVAGNSPWGKESSIGVDMDQLNQDQGLVQLIGTPNSSILTTSAVVAFVAPDAVACYVDASPTSTDPNVITPTVRVNDGGGARARNVTLTGLTSQTAYSYRVSCSGNPIESQKMGAVKTR